MDDAKAPFLGLTIAGVLCAAFVFGCVDDPTLERRGGPLPPVEQPSNMAGSPPMGTGGTTGDAAITWCEARSVLQAKCQRRHQEPPQNGAPMALLTYEDTQAPWSIDKDVHDVMLNAVQRDFMPYMALNDPPTNLMPPVEPLTADEKATLLGWLEQGALPEGGTECAP